MTPPLSMGQRLAPLAFAALCVAPTASAQLAPAGATSIGETTTPREAERARLNAASTTYTVTMHPGPDAQLRMQKLGRLASLRGQIALAKQQLRPTAILRAQFAAAVNELTDLSAKRISAARQLALQDNVESGLANMLTPNFTIHAPSSALLAKLRKRKDVASVIKDVWLLPAIETAMDAAHHNGVGAHATVHQGLPVTGDGVGIAVLDTGIDLDMHGTGRPHKAFFVNGDPSNMSGGGIGGSRIQAVYGFTPLTFPPTPTSTEDHDGHGTQVAAVIAGAKWSDGLDVADSVAFDADLYSYKVVLTTGAGSFASSTQIYAALTSAAANPDIQVANISFDGESQQQAQTVRGAVLAGLFVTLSAGNEAADLTNSTDQRVAMSVGASFENAMQPAPFSAVGPIEPGTFYERKYPDMIAQGTLVSVPVIDQELAHEFVSGTSVSAGFVAGSAALLYQVDPTLTAFETKALLINNLKALTGGDPAAGGFGYLDIHSAVQATINNEAVDGVLSGSTLSYSVTLNAGQTAQYTLCFDALASNPTDCNISISDLSGNLLAASTPSNDGVKQIKFTAPIAGSYSIDVTPMKSDWEVIPFAISGPALTTCPVGVVAQTSTSSSPIASYYPPPATPAFFIDGCNLSLVTQVNIDGIETSFQVTGDTHMQISVAGLHITGSTLVELVDPNAVTSFTVLAATVPPTLTMPSIMAPNLAYDVFVAGSGGRQFFIVGSSSDVPTVFPGVADLLIGNAANDLFLLHSGTIPVGNTFIEIPVPALPGITDPFSAKLLHTQVLMLDLNNPVLPFEVSNMESTWLFFQ